MKKFIYLALISLFSLTFTKAQEHADVVVHNATTQAKKQNKKVLVFFHASWCGWCKLMEKNMMATETKDFFDSNFVLASIDVQERGEKVKLENPGGELLMEKYDGKEAGLPFWMIMDADGNLLTTSFNDRGENLGSPSSPEEVDVFIKKLTAHTEIQPDEIAAIKKVFIKK